MTVEVNGIAAIGDVLAGKYRVLKILGIGGMGMVVAATHLELDQRVALKFMLPASNESPDTAARFLREARAAGRLNSDHVCRVIDVGRFDSGAPYIVMEYLQGENFAALLRRRGPLRVSDAIDYLLQAIEGIAEAHANGIIHRDLKPDNLFLHKRNDGETIVKVLDFGISKAAAPGLATRTGDIMGSPAYMAPEQMESSRGVDQRADVWSLGVVLYQMVAGKPPFHGDTLPMLCMQVVNDEPSPITDVRGDLPDGFEAVVMKCLQKEPDARYADVGELAHALAAFGPMSATTSASRIQLVLRRRPADSASVISTEFSTIVPSPDDGAREVTVPTKRGPEAKLASTTLGVTSGQSLAAVHRERQPRGLVGALVAGIAIVGVAIVLVWRSEPSDEGRQPRVLANPAAAPSPPAPVERPAEPAPTVEPIFEPVVEPIVTPPSPAPVAAEPPAAGPASSPVRKADLKKRKPRRPGATPVRLRAGSDAPAAVTGAGSNAGSAVEPDDDKWMHMTHDAKKP